MSQDYTRGLSDEDVLDQSINDPRLFGVIVDRYKEAFLRKAKYVMKDNDKAEDVVSETLIKIYTKASKFTPNGVGSFRSWAYTILLHTAFSHIKKERRGEVLALTDEFQDVLPDVKMIELSKQYELNDLVVRTLNKMPDSFAIVLSKFFLEEKTHEEIAREEGLSVEASKVRLHRAKKLFRNITTMMA